MYIEDSRSGSIESSGASTAEELLTSSGQLNQRRLPILPIKMGFGCRQVLGELTYAFAVGRVDISYAITLVARYSSAPDPFQYLAPKRLRKFL